LRLPAVLNFEFARLFPAFETVARATCDFSRCIVAAFLIWPLDESTARALELVLRKTGVRGAIRKWRRDPIIQITFGTLADFSGG
jgi:hypothetical protein